MATKTTIAELKQFYSDNEYWDDGVYEDDVLYVIDGIEYSDIEIESFDDEKVISIISGVVDSENNPDFKSVSLESYFKRWRKKQKTMIFIVECDKDNYETLKQIIKTNGGIVG